MVISFVFRQNRGLFFVRAWHRLGQSQEQGLLWSGCFWSELRVGVQRLLVRGAGLEGAQARTESLA